MISTSYPSLKNQVYVTNMLRCCSFIAPKTGQYHIQYRTTDLKRNYVYEIQLYLEENDKVDKKLLSRYRSPIQGHIVEFYIQYTYDKVTNSPLYKVLNGS